jgi:hypothetical protein
MPVCEVCGNDYDKAFEVRAEGSTHTFDSFVWDLIEAIRKSR